MPALTSYSKDQIIELFVLEAKAHAETGRKLRAEIEELRSKLELTRRKADHGCHNLPCPDCDSTTNQARRPGDETMTDREIIAAFGDGWKDGCDCLFVERLRASELNDTQIVAVLRAIDDTCPYCWDNDSGCQCRNDE